jgi:hypothetical protein
VFKYRRYIGAMFVVIFKFKFKLLYLSLNSSLNSSRYIKFI